jgi:hypothetical protein
LNGLADDGFDRFVEPFRARCNAHRQKGLDATATLGEPEQLEEPPYLLDRVNYLTDPAYAGRFDPNPMHAPRAAE